MQSGFGAWFHDHPGVGAAVALLGPAVLVFGTLTLAGLAKPKRRATR
jgi:hypothetical protein